MTIILIGYMGSGKSTVGKQLAEQRNIPFIDLDEYIEEKEGMPISRIFGTKGEIYFRKKEHEYLKELLAEDGERVISLGGGTPCYAGNMNLVLEHTPNVYYLSVSIPELVRRLTPAKDERPLIAEIRDEELGEFIGKHLFERRPYYTQAHFTLQADLASPEDLVDEILELSV